MGRISGAENGTKVAILATGPLGSSPEPRATKNEAMATRVIGVVVLCSSSTRLARAPPTANRQL